MPEMLPESVTWGIRSENGVRMSEKDLKNEIIRKKSSKVLQVQEKFLSLHPQSEMMANRFDSLAQQVEHNTFNVGVLGSSPKRITSIN